MLARMQWLPFIDTSVWHICWASVILYAMGASHAALTVLLSALRPGLIRDLNACRDLKPGNVLLTTSMQAKLSDMGFCKRLQAGQSHFESTGLGMRMLQCIMYATSAKVLHGPSGHRLDRQIHIFLMACISNFGLIWQA